MTKNELKRLIVECINEVRIEDLYDNLIITSYLIWYHPLTTGYCCPFPKTRDFLPHH